jgi:hypothetical protein
MWRLRKNGGLVNYVHGVFHEERMEPDNLNKDTLLWKWGARDEGYGRRTGVRGGGGNQRNWNALSSPWPRPTLGIMSTGSDTTSFSPRLLKLIRRAARDGMGRIRRSVR